MNLLQINILLDDRDDDIIYIYSGYGKLFLIEKHSIPVIIISEMESLEKG